MSRALRAAVGAVLLVVVVGAPVRAHAQSEPYGVKVESDSGNQLRDAVDAASLLLTDQCSTRSGKLGFYDIVRVTSGEKERVTLVTSRSARDAEQKTACGDADADPIQIYIEAQPGGPNTPWNPCQLSSTVLHELVAHGSGLALGHGNGGVTNGGTLQGGDYVFGPMNETECNQVDIKAGKPDYNEAGEQVAPPLIPAPGTPILLDIGGRGGIWTTGADDPVLFDMDADGAPTAMTWSAPGRSQAFLAIDLSENGAIDDGGELFGNGSFLLEEGVNAEHGFEALAQYDMPSRGGNGDGIIDSNDAVWSRLRLWSDVNHSATSHRAEIRTLDKYDIVAIELEYVQTAFFDDHDNWHRYRGYFRKRTKIQGQWVVTRELMEDVFFQPIE